ncbi:unnamed protein product, partial [marine sediment metagenome]
KSEAINKVNARFRHNAKYITLSGPIEKDIDTEKMSNACMESGL